MMQRESFVVLGLNMSFWNWDTDRVDGIHSYWSEVFPYLCKGKGLVQSSTTSIYEGFSRGNDRSKFSLEQWSVFLTKAFVPESNCIENKHAFFLYSQCSNCPDNSQCYHGIPNRSSYFGLQLDEAASHCLTPNWPESVYYYSRQGFGTSPIAPITLFLLVIKQISLLFSKWLRPTALLPWYWFPPSQIVRSKVNGISQMLLKNESIVKYISLVYF